jgi:hypothetical protein
MLMASSSPHVDADVDVGADEEGEERVHWSCCSSMRTRLDILEACEELHCRRELAWRCIRKTEVEMRE